VRYPGEGVEAGFAELLSLNHEVAAVTAACMLVRADTWKGVEGFDESIAVGFGDIDFCLRVGGAGFRVVFCPHARLVHHESMTRGVSETDPHPTDSTLYRMKWKNLMDAGDPYFSPGLSLMSYKWEIRRPLPCTRYVRRRIVTIDRTEGRERVSFSRPGAG
jgi:GT2 family glycosyltransferase